MNKEEQDIAPAIKNIAKDIFTRYPMENEVHITEDGQAFFQKAYAINHSVNNRTGEVLGIDTIEREVEKEEPKEEQLTVKQMAEILKVATADEVLAIVEAEEAMGDNARKGVLAAADKRMKELETIE